MSRILTITDSLREQAGGLSHATLNLAYACALNWPNADFLVLSQADKNEITPPECLPANLDIKSVSCFRNVFFPFSKRLSEQVDAWNPDLIHLRGLWRQPSLTCLQWKINNPNKALIVQTAGMLEPWARSRKRFLKSAYYSLFEHQLLKICDKVHATSPREMQTLVEMGVEPSKCFLVEEGVFLPSQESSFSLSESRIRKLLFLSRLHPVKGIELLLDAWAMLRPRGWVCQIAGMGHPSYVHKLKEKTSCLHLLDSVFFLGPLAGKAKKKIFSEADAFVLPSYSESFGIAIAEAMSWGLPIITTTKTPWNVIDDCDMGWLVEPTVHDLTQALFALTQCSQSSLKLMGTRSREYIAKNYDWSVISRQMISIYRSLLTL